MRLYRIVTIGLVFCGLILKPALALPDACLQSPERQNACPHLIYKKAALPVPLLKVKKGEVICICMTDLKALKHKAKGKLEQIDQKVTLQRTAKKYQLSEQDILDLVRS